MQYLDTNNVHLAVLLCCLVSNFRPWWITIVMWVIALADISQTVIEAQRQAEK